MAKTKQTGRCSTRVLRKADNDENDANMRLANASFELEECTRKLGQLSYELDRLRALPVVTEISKDEAVALAKAKSGYKNKKKRFLKLADDVERLKKRLNQ